MGNRNVFLIVLAVLIGVGFLSQFSNNPGGLIIPLLVFGFIYYFMRFPAGSRNFWPWSRKGPTYRKKPWKWKVLKGNKKDDQHKHGPPPFH